MNDNISPRVPPPENNWQSSAFPTIPSSQPGAVIPSSAPTNGLAIVAFVLSLFLPIVGIITGHIALNQIKRTGESGRSLALAGTIIGYSITGIVVLGGLLYLLVLFGLLFGTYAIGSQP